MTPARDKTDLLPGTLDMIVLRTLSVQPMHGYGISLHVSRLSDGVLKADPGSLYPSLERLQRQGWVKSKWTKSPTGRRARYYTITAAGERQLGREVEDFERTLAAIHRLMHSS